jgi:hypothetical protein
MSDFFENVTVLQYGAAIWAIIQTTTDERGGKNEN